MRKQTFRDGDDEWDDDFDEDWDDDEPDDDELDDDDRRTVPCPYCRQPVFEDAEYCANCDEFISLEDAPPEQKPLWMVVTVLLLLASMLWWLIL